MIKMLIMLSFFALIAFGSLVLIAVDYVGLKGIGETFIMVVRLC